MNPRAWTVGILVLAVIGLVLWIRGDLDPASPSGESRESSDETVDGGTIAPEAEGRGAKGVLADRGPTLAGRPGAALRRGRGAVRCRLVLAKDHAPVVGVPATFSASAEPPASLEVVSDDTGLLLFADVAPGKDYALRVEAGERQRRVFGGIEVVAGQTTDLGTIFLGGDAALSGIVVNDAGEGVAGAEVRVLPEASAIAATVSGYYGLFSDAGREREPLAKTVTQSTGRFRFEGLPLGPLVLRATGPGFHHAVGSVFLSKDGPAAGEPRLVLEQADSISGVVVDEAGNPVPGARVVLLPVVDSKGVPAEELVNADAVVTDATGTFAAPCRRDEPRLGVWVTAEGYGRASVLGRRAGETGVRVVLRADGEREIVVQSARSEPLPGALVVCHLLDPGDGPGDAYFRAVGGATDEAGRFRFRLGRAHWNELWVDHPRHGSGKATWPKAGGAPIIERFFSLEVEDGGSRVLVRLAPGVTVSGVVRRSGGLPVEGAEVLAFDGAHEVPADRAVTDRQGEFSVSVDPKRSYLRVRAEGWVLPGGRVEVKAPEPGGAVRLDLTLVQARQVRGHVLDEEACGIAGASVVLRPAVADGQDSLADSSVTTAADGTYVVYGVPPPSVDPSRDGVVVVANAEGFLAGLSDSFRLEETGPTTAPPVVLHRGAELRGHTNEKGGGPIGGVRVTLTRGGRPSQRAAEEHVTFSQADGSFRVSTLFAGEWWAEASRPGFVTVGRTVRIRPETPPEVLEIALPRASDLSGRVIDLERRPVAGASVATIEDDPSLDFSSARTLSDGSFILRALPVGRNRLVVTAAGFRQATPEVEVGRGSVEVVLERTGP